ncbi:hypothetical protein L6452_37738 [Arctium lappa]|uniref:Uncharacterized protein n=1 Tax=Arctium lappa TaxID=4217 RepID=A0ACB8Y3R9_ARCLA|nr:hypothetical protein L6452_37738 [Arctium lappa]
MDTGQNRSPDGYSLFACSLDGTVATFHFEVKELGQRLSDVELEELKKSRYGLGITSKVSESLPDLSKNDVGVFDDAANRVATPSTRVSSPVKQREYRRPDGRKRIILEAVRVPVQGENISGATQSQTVDFSMKSTENGVVHADAGFREGPNKRQTVGGSDIKMEILTLNILELQRIRVLFDPFR